MSSLHPTGPRPQRMPHAGHPRALQHVLGRRKLTRGAAATAGLAFSWGLWMPTLALAREDRNRTRSVPDKFRKRSRAHRSRVAGSE
jgi:hypothetical protein